MPRHCRWSAADRACAVDAEDAFLAGLGVSAASGDANARALHDAMRRACERQNAFDAIDAESRCEAHDATPTFCTWRHGRCSLMGLESGTFGADAEARLGDFLAGRCAAARTRAACEGRACPNASQFVDERGECTDLQDVIPFAEWPGACDASLCPHHEAYTQHVYHGHPNRMPQPLTVGGRDEGTVELACFGFRDEDEIRRACDANAACAAYTMRGFAPECLHASVQSTATGFGFPLTDVTDQIRTMVKHDGETLAQRCPYTCARDALLTEDAETLAGDETAEGGIADEPPLRALPPVRHFRTGPGEPGSCWVYVDECAPGFHGRRPRFSEGAWTRERFTDTVGESDRFAQVISRRWRAVDEPPDGGVPIISQELANALVDGQREFDAGEWASLGIDAPVAENSYVEVDAAVFRPLSRRERCRDRANLAKDVCQVANSHWIAPRHDFERATNVRWRPRADQPVADLRYAAEDAQRCASRTANVRSVDNASTCASVPVDRCDEYFDQCPTGFRHNFRELGLRWVRVGSADGTCAPDGLQAERGDAAESEVAAATGAQQVAPGEAAPGEAAGDVVHWPTRVSDRVDDAKLAAALRGRRELGERLEFSEADWAEFATERASLGRDSYVTDACGQRYAPVPVDACFRDEDAEGAAPVVFACERDADGACRARQVLGCDRDPGVEASDLASAPLGPA